jgi:hypothetical protein
VAAQLLAGCGSHSSAPATVNVLTRPQTAAGAQAPPSTTAPAAKPRPLVSAPGQIGGAWTVVATIAGQPAAWVAERSGVTLLRFDQGLVHLVLHAGSSEPAGGGFRHGSQIGRSEAHRVVAAFNGGFKLGYGEVGFMADGHVAVPLSAGLGSIVTYRDGSTQVGAWHEGVPVRGRAIVSVLQDLHLMLDHGSPAATVESCASCWGATLGGGLEVARSALGITGDGQLVFAAGERLSPAAIARAMSAVGVQRAVELDINPQWVAAYLYVHASGAVGAVPLVPGQAGIPGQLLSPYSRDFFTVVAN